MITRRAHIAFNALGYLAKQSRAVNRFEIAYKINESDANVQTVLYLLSRARIVRSYTGPRGGYRLDRETAKRVTALDVLNAVGYDLKLDPSLRLLAGQRVVFDILEALSAPLEGYVYE